VSRLAPESDAGGATATDAAAVAAPSPRAGEIVDALRSALGDGFLAHHYSANDAWVRVAPSSWREAARVCRDALGLTYLSFVAGIDWKLAPGLGGEKRWDPDAEPTADPGDGPGRWVTGLAGGDTRFQVFARLYDVVRHVGVTLKADAGDGPDGEGGGAPAAQSWVPLFRGADWHEREAWEMYGIEFDGHPGLRHLYLPGEFEGFPLRKDFPLLAREVKPWPGLVNVEGLPGEDEPTESGDVDPE
jgi:NADH-quinone oxidoreductase subunit C